MKGKLFFPHQHSLLRKKALRMSQLQVGVFESDICPQIGTHLIGHFGPRVSVNIKDPLYAKAMVIDNGAQKVALVTVDLCMIERAEVDAAKAIINERLGIVPENVLVSATHTHTGPAAVSILAVDKDPEYAAMLPWKIADAVQCAAHRLQPVEMVYGECEVAQVFNRRWWMKDGSVKMNPGFLNPDMVRPAGPVDRTLAVLSFRNPQSKKPVAMYVNYPLHYVGSAPDDHFSADYFARVDHNLRRALGVEMAIVSNGTTGDVNNCDYTNPAPHHDHPDGQQIKVAGIVAAAAARTFYESELVEDLTLAGALDELEVTRRELDKAQLAKDRNTIGGMDRMNPTTEQVNAFERLKMAEMPMKWKTWIGALRIGNIAYVGLPGEIFVEIGLEIKERSPMRTNCVELANDWQAYICTPHAFDEGSYETMIGTANKLVPKTATDFIDSALGLLGKLV